MRSIDMLKSLLRVFEQEGGHVGWIQRLLFFPPRKLTYIQNYISESLDRIYSGKDGEKLTDFQGCMGHRGKREVLCNGCASTDRNLEEAEVFSPPLLLLNCQIILSFDAGAWHRHGDGPGLTFSPPQIVLLI